MVLLSAASGNLQLTCWYRRTGLSTTPSQRRTLSAWLGRYRLMSVFDPLDEGIVSPLSWMNSTVSELICVVAAYHGHTHIVQYAINAGWEWCRDDVRILMAYSDTLAQSQLSNGIFKHAYQAAVASGSVDQLRLMSRPRSLSWTHLMTIAARHNKVRMFTYLMRCAGFDRPSFSVYRAAAIGNSVDIFRYTDGITRLDGHELTEMRGLATKHQSSTVLAYLESTHQQ